MVSLTSTLFTADVPMIATIPSIEFELFGVPVDVVNGKRNNQTHLEKTRVMINAKRLIEIYSEGHRITLPFKEDVSRLFILLDSYLSEIIKANSMSVNKISVDVTFVEEVDKFCMEMFSFNRATIVQKCLMQTQKSGYNITDGLMAVKHAGHSPSNITKADVTPYYPGQRKNFMDMIPDQPNINYVVNQSPTLDMDKIKRESVMKHL